MRPGIAITALWLLWGLSWLAAAGWSNTTTRKPEFRLELLNRLPLVAGLMLMFIPAHGYQGPLRLWHVNLWQVWLCVALIAAGLAFAWWARVHLGRLWSGAVTLKTDHRVIDTGPYAWVRHPIYSGLLLALIATTVAKGTVWGVAGLALSLLSLWMKARLEERWLSQSLPAGAYEHYRRRVPMLLPLPRPHSD